MATLTCCRYCRLPMVIKDPPPLEEKMATPDWEFTVFCSNCGAGYQGRVMVANLPRISAPQLRERMNEVSK